MGKKNPEVLKRKRKPVMMLTREKKKSLAINKFVY